ncbi:MAG TPA: hypothetical protein VIJ62_00685 [Rhizomicrobium sp.]
MDAKILIRAVEKAIAGGAVAAPAQDFLGPDASFVRTQTDVGIETAIFDAYVADLRADPKMAEFDGTFANVPHGGSIGVGLPNIARVLLARALVTQDVAGTVNAFIEAVHANGTDAIAVMGIAGVKAEGPIQLGPDIRLIPMTDVPPSMQRGTALGQGPFNAMGPRFAIPHALVTRFKFGPVFYRPKNPQPPEDMAARVPTDAAQMLLAEAFDLLAVLGVYPHYHMFWVQSDNWFLSAGMNSGWQFSRSGEHWARDADISTEEAEPLALEYFALDLRKRHKVLRIPLDRLGRAGREGDFADRAIDLGIALESLLLGDNDLGELSFRLSLHGAWLIGNDEAERLEIQKSLKKLYELRSRAVHSGAIERSAKTGTTIARATEISQSLIRKAIELKCEIDWQRLVVGGTPNSQA